MTTCQRSLPWVAGLLNVALVVCVVWQYSALRRSFERTERLSGELETIESEFAERLLANLQAQESRVSQKESTIVDLRGEIDWLRQLLDEGVGRDTAEEPQASDLGSVVVAANSPVTRLISRPDIGQVPILDHASFEALLERRRNIPRDLRDRLLLEGDIDAVLQSPEWNRRGAVLEAEDRMELAALLKDYRFYTRTSRAERVKKVELPLVERMREVGAYVEYPAEEAPPRIHGATITHSEPTDDPNVYRLYPFFEEDHPELYHAKTVEYQRSLETFVRVYELINKGD